MSRPSLLSRLAAALRGDRPLADRGVAELEGLLADARAEEREVRAAIKAGEARSLAGLDPTELREHAADLGSLRLLNGDGQLIGGRLKGAVDSVAALSSALIVARQREQAALDATVAERFSTASPFPGYIERLSSLIAEVERVREALSADVALAFTSGVRGRLSADPFEGCRAMVRKLLGDRIDPAARVAFEGDAPTLLQPSGPKIGDARRRFAPDLPSRGVREIFDGSEWGPETDGPVVRGA